MPVTKEIICPNQDCNDGACQTGTSTVYQECIYGGYSRGGCSTSTSDLPAGCLRFPAADYLCGDLFPLNTAFCCS